MKILGILLIFLVCSFGGFSVSGIYKKRTEQLEAFRNFIVFIGVQIESYRTPLDIIFSRYRNKVLDKCKFTEKLSEIGWERALNETSADFFLSEREMIELKNFFAHLGTFDGENAVKHCLYYEKIFSAFASKAKEEAIPKSKICRALGFLAGIMIAVLFI